MPVNKRKVSKKGTTKKATKVLAESKITNVETKLNSDDDFDTTQRSSRKKTRNIKSQEPNENLEKENEFEENDMDVDADVDVVNVSMVDDYDIEVTNEEDGISDSENKPAKKSRAKPTKKKAESPPKVNPTKKKVLKKDLHYNHTRSITLETKNPTTCATYIPGMIRDINIKKPLELKSSKMQTPGEIYAIALSNDGTLLASCNTIGDICVWDSETNDLLLRMRDENEDMIYEYFTLAFSPDSRYIYAGGKRKSRKKWSTQDNDNSILPCPIKIFDLVENTCIESMVGHTEEIMDLLPVTLDGKNYLISGSQDGCIKKWTMSDDWKGYTLVETMVDEITCMVFHLCSLPNCGNKYFLAACDQTIKIFDLETCEQKTQFETLYSCYCDFALVVDGPELEELNNGFYVLSRGVEEITEEGLATEPNKVCLHIITYPNVKNPEWRIETKRTFEDQEYFSNSYSCGLATNGYYVAAPTVTGSVFVWNISTGVKVAVLKDENSAEREIRDLKFHETDQTLIIAGDDGVIRVFGYP